MAGKEALPTSSSTSIDQAQGTRGKERNVQGTRSSEQDRIRTASAYGTRRRDSSFHPH